MRLPRSPADAAILSTLLLPFLSEAAGNFDCNHIRVDKKGFDLSELGGPKSVFHNFVRDSTTNVTTTYTIDICKPLGKVKDIAAAKQCPNGTRGELSILVPEFHSRVPFPAFSCSQLTACVVCAIKRLVTEDSDTFDEAIAIAGELGGKAMEAHWDRLKTSPSHEKGGLRLQLNGGFRNLDSGMRDQKAIVEFICDKNRSGNENLYDPEDKYTEGMIKRGENNEADDNDPNSPSLKFFSYDEGTGDADILRLVWRTEHACEDSKNEQDAEKGNHWGFFTWFILMCVLPNLHPPDIFLGTDLSQQCLFVYSDLLDLWFMAQLQPIRCPRLGPPSSR